MCLFSIDIYFLPPPNSITENSDSSGETIEWKWQKMSHCSVDIISYPLQYLVFLTQCIRFVCVSLSGSWPRSGSCYLATTRSWQPALWAPLGIQQKTGKRKENGVVKKKKKQMERHNVYCRLHECKRRHWFLWTWVCEKKSITVQSADWLERKTAIL